MVARNMDAFHNLYWDTITENNNNIFSNIPQNESDKFQVVCSLLLIFYYLMFNIIALYLLNVFVEKDS